MLFYEPSNEDDIKRVLNKYMDSSCQRPSGYNLSNMRITSNLEKEMVEIYSNDIVPKFSSFKIPMKTLLFMEFEALVSGTISFATDNQTTEAILSQKGKENQILLSVPGAAISAKYKQGILVMTFGNTLFGYSLKSNLFQETFSIIVSDIHFNGTLSLGISNNDNFTFVYFQTSYNSSNVTVQIYSNTKQSLISTLVINFPFNFDKLDADSYYDDNLKAWTIAFATCRRIPNYLTGHTHVISYSIAELDANFSFKNLIANPSYNGWGHYPRVKLINNPLVSNELVVLASFTNGSCQAGFFLNNNQLFKCYRQVTKYNAAYLNVFGLIGYHFGKVSDFIKSIQNEEIFSGCSSSIYKAKLANGMHPYVAIDEKGDFLVAYETLLYDELPFITRMFCGAVSRSETFKGIKISQFSGLYLK